MSKSKGIVLGDQHLSPGNKTIVGPGFGHSTRGIEAALADDESRVHSRPDHPPAHTTHVAQSETKAERFFAGNPDVPGGLNSDSRDGSVMGLDNRPGTATADSPVPVRGRELPHVGVTSKAQEVAREDPSAGLGVRPTGTLSR
jgi:hypothetical protein